MNVDWGTVLGTGFGGAMLYSMALIVKTALGKRMINADAAAKLSNSANEMIQAVRIDAEKSIEHAYKLVEDARKELAEARIEVTQARQEATEARREATLAQREATDARRSSDESLYIVRRLTQAILSPNATLDGLREIVGGFNGARAYKPSE